MEEYGQFDTSGIWNRLLTITTLNFKYPSSSAAEVEVALG